MGESAGTFAVNSGGKDDQFRSGKAHHISSRQKENRSRTKGTVGEVESGEEVGWLEAKGACCEDAAGFHSQCPLYSRKPKRGTP
jgi:hypothetical protein